MMKCQLPVAMRLRMATGAEVEVTGCERDARLVEAKGFLVVCPDHRQVAVEEHELDLEDLYCELVLFEGSQTTPSEICGKAAEFRTEDGFLRCRDCRDESVENGGPANYFKALGAAE